MAWTGCNDGRFRRYAVCQTTRNVTAHDFARGS
jgi:hypothetical protein